jgi:hypothetical protein
MQMNKSENDHFYERYLPVRKERFQQVFCPGCDYAMPIVPETGLCADCTSPGFAVWAYRKMKERSETK